MILQAKQIRAALKTVGILNRDGKLPSVRTERLYAGNGDYEYGEASAHAVALSQDEVDALEKLLPHGRIYNNPELGFSVISN